MVWTDCGRSKRSRRAIVHRELALESSSRSIHNSQMFRESIKNMAPYKPGEQPKPGERLIKLNTNENPYPPSPRVRRAMVKVAADSLRLYPAPRADAFVESASKLYGVRKAMILAANGSDALLVVVFPPT